MAGFLLLILSASGLSSTFVQRPFSVVSLLISLVGLALTLSIWNELEGPLPFRLTTRNALVVLLSVFALGLFRTPTQKLPKSKVRAVSAYPSSTTVIRAERDQIKPK
jgi:peptidoglycan/LPS O-acetylase OafA/YrhL